MMKRLCAYFGLAVLSCPLGCNPCGKEIWSNVPSPDSKWVAVTIMRDCGATTSEVVSVNVHPIGEKKLSAENNALVVKHGYAISTIWQNSTTLSIECRECVPKEIIMKRDKVGSILLVYSLPQE